MTQFTPIDLNEASPLEQSTVDLKGSPLPYEVKVKRAHFSKPLETVRELHRNHTHISKPKVLSYLAIIATMACSLAILMSVADFIAPMLKHSQSLTSTDDYTTAKVFAIDAQRKIIMKQSGDPASSTVIVKGRPEASQPRMAIAYLTRNTKSDALYQRDSNLLLAKSLDLVFENVMPYTAADIIIFHEGDFNSEDQKQVIKGRPHIKFHTLSAAEWGPPAFVDEKELTSWHEGKKYGMGYRNMIRFYANRIWPLVSSMGYEYVMRLDEESFIYSPIKYDMAEYMTAQRLVYGYRQDQTEYPTMQTGWPEAVGSYLQHYDIEPTFLYDHCTPRNIAGLKTGLHDLHSYYNNFFIARVDFFTSPKVQQFLNYADRTGGYYYSRWGDAIVHTAAVQIFLHKSEVHKFTDFSYEHATLNKTDNSLVWGGLAVGTEDANGPTRAAEFVKAHKSVMKWVW